MRKILIFTITLIIGTAGISYSQDRLKTTVIRVGGIELTVEIAADRKAREKGLMYRDALSHDRGMLFVYPKEAKRRLWMKNTFIPLSAAFIKADGRITEIARMEKINSVKIYKSKEKAKYALEVSLGWFEKNGIAVGNYCSIPEISD